jgi:hypothetical protein
MVKYSMESNSRQQNLEMDNVEVDLQEAEIYLSKQLEENFSDLKQLEIDRNNISNPDSLGKTISDEVWKQFGNQIGLDMTNETLIQKYNREHPETYEEAAKEVMQDKRYQDAHKEMEKKQEKGELVDTYTGEQIKPNDPANLDHVVSRKEIYDNERRKQAQKSVADVANKKENLKPTNESLNKSKKEKSVEEYTDEEKRKQREKDLIEQTKRANKKVDESNKSEEEKRAQKRKNNKRLKNKLSANKEKMSAADKKARAAINTDIYIGVAKETGKKAGKDALKTMAISALFALLKEIMNGLVRYFKSSVKSFQNFLNEMKKSIKSFLSKILGIMKTGVSTAIGTIVSEIFGPIVSLFKKVASLIKQGISSVIEAVNYLKDNKNKDKPFAIKVAEIGKIITVGLAGAGALALGEVFEKVLLTVPGMQIVIPMLGTLANIIGLFLSSLVAGLAGAIVLNFIDKFIAKKLKAASNKEIRAKKNDAINTQLQLINVNGKIVANSYADNMKKIVDNHEYAGGEIRKIVKKVFSKEDTTSSSKKPKNSKHKSDYAEMGEELGKLI